MGLGTYQESWEEGVQCLMNFQSQLLIVASSYNLKPLNPSYITHTEEYSGCLYDVIILSNRTFASIIMFSHKCFPCFCQRDVIIICSST